MDNQSSISQCQNPGCSNQSRLLSSGKGYAMHCSRKCTNIHNSLKGNEKRIATLSKKSKEEYNIADLKRRSTCLERYGVEYNLQRPEVIEINSCRGSKGNAEVSEKVRKSRSANMKKLNLENSEFQEKRIAGFKKFLDSDDSIEYRIKKSELAKEQHKNGQAEHVKKYFKEKYQGSDTQKRASDRLKTNNPNNIPGVQEKKKNTYIQNSEKGLHNKETRFKKKRYGSTELIYQSSYELDFLKYCDQNNILHRIANAPILTSKDYPYNYYLPDFLIDNEYIVEIKSWYIEETQEKKYPGILAIKKALVESKGYKFLYIRDKDYSTIP